MIIIPTYNERKNIRPLVDRIRAVLADVPILFVEDSSPDGTAEEIKNLQQSDSNVHLLLRPGKAGFASAYLDGFRYALKNLDPKYIVTMDADLSHPPEKLLELIGQAVEGKVAIGSRYTKGGGVENWEFRRRCLSRLGNLYAYLMTKLPIKDITSGFIAMPIEKIKTIDFTTIKSHGYAFLMELKVRLSKLGSNFVEIPITFVERKEGESKISSAIMLEGMRYPSSVFIERQFKVNYPAWLVFLISNVIYISTLPHTIFFGDSPEFMASASSVGIPHPPGYPAYVLIAKLFTFLPVGNLEFRIGLFSALCASLALVVFYFLFLKVINNRIIVFVAALILGFSNIFWSQAIMAKVYSPLLLITLLVLLLMEKYITTGKHKYILWSFFLFGFGTGFHQTILLFFPVVLFTIFAHMRSKGKILSQRFNLKPILVTCMMFLLGLSIFIYLPVRKEINGNFYDFSKIFRTTAQPNTVKGFIDYVKRTEYKEFTFKFVWDDKKMFITSFFQYLWKQFYWLLVFALLALITLWFTNRRFWCSTVYIFFINSIGIILLRTSSWGYENDFMYQFYYLPAFAMTAIWIGIGLHQIYKWFPRSLTLSLIIPLVFVYLNFRTNDLSKFSFVDDYTRTVLVSLDNNAILLAQFNGANLDTLQFGLSYQKIVKHIRPDVTILFLSDAYPELDPNIAGAVFGFKSPENARYHLLNYTLKRAEYKDRPIYTTYVVDGLGENQKWTSVSNGLVYKFLPELSTEIVESKYYSLDPDKDLLLMENDMYGKDILSQYYYSQAAYFVQNKDLKQAQDYFVKGLMYDYRLNGIDQKSYINYRNRIFGKE